MRPAIEWVRGCQQRIEASLGLTSAFRRRRWLIALVLGLCAMALLTFPAAYAAFGDAAIHLLLIPVALTAAALGARWGLLVLVVSDGLVAGLMSMLGGQARDVLSPPDLVTGVVVVVAFGTMRGALLRTAASQAELAASIDNAADGIITSDPQGRVLAFNVAAQRIFGYSASDVIGSDLDRLIPRESVGPHREHIRRYASGAADGQRFMGMREVWGVRRNGERFPTEISIARTIVNGRVAMTATVRDISERKCAEAEIERRTFYDEVTGLPNRVKVQEELRAALSATAQSTPLALLTLNLDDFHEINDTFGYAAGDRILREVGLRLSRLAPEVVGVGRTGGDEFGVIARVPDAAAGRALAERALREIEGPFDIDGLRIGLGCGVGLAHAPADGSDPVALLRSADIAMARAKALGRAVVAFSPTLVVSTPARLALVADLREAIGRGEIAVVFQPQVSLRTGAIVGVEALARWWHRERGAISPPEFVGLAERSGLIDRLTEGVLAAALRAADGPPVIGPPVRLSVNVSMRNLTPGFPDLVARLMAEHHSDPTLLTIEVTETALASGIAAALPVLLRLRALGVRLSVDDFGTGYSSLAYLARLPVQEVKIDVSFVRDLVRDSRTAAVVRATIALAADLGLETVAEGVEDHATWTMLRDMGCTSVQGFFIGPPMDRSDLAEWARTRGLPPVSSSAKDHAAHSRTAAAGPRRAAI